MPGPGERSFGYLGDLGVRLQRFLGFDGDPNASFSPVAVPVIVVGDATAPGYGEAKGRRFTHFSSIAAGGFLCIRAEADVVIELVRFQVTNAAAGSLLYGLTALDFADPGMVPCGLNIDRLIGAADRPPLVGVSNATPTVFTNVGNAQIAANQQSLPHWTLCPTPFALAARRGIVFNCITTNVVVELWGYTL